MDSVFRALKQAREAKNLSLADVADTTFIGIRYLEAIEAGKTDILPQAYVRAFIREFATVVGLDPAEVMRNYDNPAPSAPTVSDTRSAPVQDLPSTEQAPPVAATTPAPEAMATPVPEARPQPRPVPDREPAAPAPRRDLTDIIQKAAVVMGVIVIAIVLWNVMGIEKPKTREIPFQNVIKENELHASGPVKKDSTHVPGVQGSRIDSLTLQAQTTDSVWVQVIVDDGIPHEYLFRPNARATWKAAEKFVLTVGNAGAVQLTLNKKDLGTLGKKGSVIQKLELTRQSLTR